MPRKPNTATLQEYDCRVTPTDQEVIAKEEWMSAFLDPQQILVCQEGGNDSGKKLHYHVYIKANYSETYLRKQLAKLGRATEYIKGNAVFKISQAHDHTIGYVIKENNVIHTNFENHVIEEYFKTSQEYRKELETERKRKVRNNDNTLKEILDSIEVTKNDFPLDLTEKVLNEYEKLGKRFPPRSALQTAILGKIYKFHPSYVINWYSPELPRS